MNIILDGSIVGTAYCTEFPMDSSVRVDDCSSIIISHGVEIYQHLRGQGLGQRAHQERIRGWQTSGYNYALCTVRRDNDIQLHILNKNGWVRLANTASLDGTPIYLMGRNLK